MPQRFLSIKNFEKYQTMKFTTAPWFKLQKSFFGDREVTKLSIESRFLFIGLIYLATECNNKIYNDKTWIAQRLYISTTEVNLTPLYKAGFLNAPNLSRELRVELSREELSRVDPPIVPQRVTRARGKVALPDELVLTPEERVGWDSFGIQSAIEFAAFKDHARSEDRRCSDWEAAKRNWMRKAIRMKEERANRGLLQVR